jgi:hypothetical protein
MARRMFSPKIVGSDAFLDMPISTQALYFHLGMEADDDGFVNPKKTMRVIGASEDDLKVLVGKRFVLPFENGVVVIKHWRINNQIRKDFHRDTVYLEEKARLKIKDNGSYTENVNKMLTIRSRRIGKDSIGKDINTQHNEEKTQINKDIVEVITAFKEVNPSYIKWFAIAAQRSSIERMLSVHGKGRVLKVVAFLPQSNTIPYIPTITSPFVLEEKWADLQAGLTKIKNKQITNQPNVIM